MKVGDTITFDDGGSKYFKHRGHTAVIKAMDDEYAYYRCLHEGDEWRVAIEPDDQEGAPDDGS